MLLDLGLRLVVHLLDPRRVDAAVLDQLRQRQPRDLAAEAVERREHDGVRRVVDDEVDAGQVLERADVATLAADDPALHVVGRQLDDRDGRLGRVARRDALERVGDEVARAPLRLRPRLLLELPDAAGELVPDELLAALEQRAAFASACVIPAIRSSSSSSRVLRLPSAPPGAASGASRGRRAPARARSSSTSFCSTSSSFASTRSSIFSDLTRAGRRARASISARSLTACSRASICASRRIASASRRGVLEQLVAEPARLAHAGRAERRDDEQREHGADGDSDGDSDPDQHVRSSSLGGLSAACGASHPASGPRGALPKAAARGAPRRAPAGALAPARAPAVYV